MEHTVQKIVREADSLVKQGRTSEAIWCLEHVAAEALNLLGLYNYEYGGSKDEGLRHLKLASQVKRCNWSIFNNMAHVANQGGDYAVAAQYSRRACELCNGVVYDPYYNLGVILANVKDYKGAIEAYHKGVSLNPTHPPMRHNLSTCLLCDGQFEEGWQEYEHRLTTGGRTQDMYKRFAEYPVWDGSPLKGKKLLVYSEQGIGDLIQFSRWIPHIKGHVSLECQQAIHPLMKKCMKIKHVTPRGDGEWIAPEKLPPFDLVIPVCSLAKVFKATPENTPNDPYLFVKSKKKCEKITGCKAARKIGICWAGNHGHQMDHYRTIHLNWFRGISELPDVQLFSLQKNTLWHRRWLGQSVNLLEGISGMDVIDLETEIESLMDVAEFMSQMDLIITVDTAIAHLAGAMGLPTWLLVPFIPDWRWGYQGEKTFWYPSIKLIRQESRGEWAGVFNTIKELLAQNKPGQ